VAGQEEAWAALPGRAELPRQFTGAQVTGAWESAGANLKPETIKSRKILRPLEHDAVQVAVPDRAVEPGGTRSPRMLWRSPPDVLASVDPSKGCTVEVRGLVFSATAPLSGLELHAQLAYPDGRAKRFRIAIAPSRVFALHNNEIRVIGYNLNTSGSHAYRIAVRPEGSAQKLTFARLNQEMSGLEMELSGENALRYEDWAMRRPRDVDFVGRSPGFRYLRAKGNSIEGGTSEILRNIVAERVLGLPSEPRVDIEVPWKDLAK